MTMNNAATGNQANWPDSLVLYHAARQARARIMMDLFVTAAGWVAWHSGAVVLFVRWRQGGRVPKLEMGHPLATKARFL